MNFGSGNSMWDLAYLARYLVIINLLLCSINANSVSPPMSVPETNPSVWIVGKWKMVTVLEGNQDITPVHNPNNDRWIEFKEDGTFESGGGPQGENSGIYQVDNQANTLFLDSDAGDGDDSNWRLQFREHLLYMRGIGTNRQEMTTVICERLTD